MIFFTSGTVSYPKMVLHRQSYALGHVGTARHWHGVGLGDRHWTIADTGWAKAAWGSLFGQWHERATVFQANLAKQTAASILSIIRAHSVTSLCAPPTLYRMLVQEDLKACDLSCLRQCDVPHQSTRRRLMRSNLACGAIGSYCEQWLMEAWRTLLQENRIHGAVCVRAERLIRKPSLSCSRVTTASVLSSVGVYRARRRVQIRVVVRRSAAQRLRLSVPGTSQSVALSHAPEASNATARVLNRPAGRRTGIIKSPAEQSALL